MRVFAIAMLAPTIAVAQPGAVQPVPVSVPPADPFAAHQGLTLEVNVGIGFDHVTDASGLDNPIDSDAALAGANLGIGGWLTPRLALTFRVAGVDVSSMDVQFGTGHGTLEHAFFGPTLQYWLTSHLWIGGGIGFATYRYIHGGCNTTVSSCSTNGFGGDLRAGFTFGSGPHTFNLSVEANPSYFSNTDGTGTATSLALLAGYQFL